MRVKHHSPHDAHTQCVSGISDCIVWHMTGSNSKPDLKALFRHHHMQRKRSIIWELGTTKPVLSHLLKRGSINGHTEIHYRNAGQHHGQLAEAYSAAYALVLFGNEARLVLASPHFYLLQWESLIRRLLNGFLNAWVCVWFQFKIRSYVRLCESAFVCVGMDGWIYLANGSKYFHVGCCCCCFLLVTWYINVC